MRLSDRTSPLVVLVVAATFAACGSDNNTGGEKDTSAPEDSVAPDTDTAEETETSACTTGAPCDDDDPCTVDDKCGTGGACVGTAKDCDDGLACTTDTCTAGACEHATANDFCVDGGACVPVNGAVPGNACRVCRSEGGSEAIVNLPNGDQCSDGDQCTSGDTCQAGACVGGAPRTCTSDDVCIAASCDPDVGCVESPSTAPCDDGNPCTVDDTCGDGACQAGATPLDCDDGDPCTIDTCDPAAGCLHDAESKCNDHDPCTNDSCGAGGVCTNASFTGPCDDSDPCTLGEVCDAGGTCGGGTALSCDDDNVCTTDACIPGEGCLNLFRTEDCDGGTCGPAACDDGEACTTDDRCVAGECFGGKTVACPLCPIASTDDANKIISLLVMADGNPGSGLDIDGDPMTCAPAGACGGGVDNELSRLAAFVNPGIEDSITGGVVKWIVDLRDATFDGQEFPIAIYDSQATDLTCDYQVERCEYDVAELSFDALCSPYFHFDNARIEDDTLTAGGTGELINMVLPLQGDALLGVTIAAARTEGTITRDPEGNIVSINGIIAGAIPKAQLIEAVRSLDPNSFSLPGLDPEAAAALLDDIITSDIDLDGDGLAEAASVSMRIQTIPASIFGTLQP